MIISKDFKFEAAHYLRNYEGKCARLHGHSYYGTVWIKTDILDSTGFVVDYGDISDIIDEYDHQDLNQLNDFKNYNPTAENIAKAILIKVSKKSNKGCIAVKLHETTSSMAFCTTSDSLNFLAL